MKITLILILIICLSVFASCRPKTSENEINTSDTAIIEEINLTDTTQPAGLPGAATQK